MPIREYERVPTSRPAQQWRAPMNPAKPGGCGGLWTFCTMRVASDSFPMRSAEKISSKLLISRRKTFLHTGNFVLVFGTVNTQFLFAAPVPKRKAEAHRELVIRGSGYWRQSCSPQRAKRRVVGTWCRGRFRVARARCLSLCGLYWKFERPYAGYRVQPASCSYCSRTRGQRVPPMRVGVLP